jgi:hypothetical protein
MLLLAKTPVNVVISNACVAKIKYFLKKCPRQLWNLEKIKDFLKYYSKKPLNRISLFIIFRVVRAEEPKSSAESSVVMSKVIVENTMRYAKKRTPADQKCDKFAQAVNIEVCSSQSESESISEEGDTYAESGHISQTREEESEQNSRPKEKFGSRGPQSTH